MESVLLNNIELKIKECLADGYYDANSIKTGLKLKKKWYEV